MSLSERVNKLLDLEVLEIQLALRYQDGVDYNDLKVERRNVPFYIVRKLELNSMTFFCSLP